MEKETLIQVQGVFKKYSRSLRRSMVYGLLDIGRNVLGRSSHADQLRQSEFWAVKDVSFEVGRGETLGIIGPNGSGKSTLLKMINGIFWPDQGKIVVKGRVGALIEVGAGFHPLLTGRENIFVNGAILGMSRAEVKRKFDRIVDFAGIGTAIDMPVKNYSSGMFVRLGFAVAVHCDPEVLLVDEVLAVGDLAFQSRCREKIRELRQQDVTIFLVSHNMHTISHLCRRTLFMHFGEQVFTGETSQAIDLYRRYQQQGEPADFSRSSGQGLRVTGIDILEQNGLEKKDFSPGDYVKFRIHLFSAQPVKNPVISLAIYTDSGEVITGIRNDVDGVQSGVVQGEAYCDLEVFQLNLLPDVYTVNVTFLDPDGFTFYDRIEAAAKIWVTGGKQVNGVVYFPHRWLFHLSPSNRDK